MSIKSFCASAGFSTNTYFYWQNKLRETACRELAAQSENRNKAIVPSGWSVCNTAESAAKSKALTIEIGSFKVTVDENFEPQLLTKVCKALLTLC